MPNADNMPGFATSSGITGLSSGAHAAPNASEGEYDDAGRVTAEASLAALTLEDDHHHHGISPGLIGHGDDGMFGSGATGGFSVLNSSIWRNE
jgi:hypothetical protein